MRKVIVIGCPGGGKSTFSKKLNNKTGLPLYHLDMMYWNNDRTTICKEIFLDRLKSVLETAEWIIDGNYLSSMEMRLKECDTVFFLDYPTDVCMDGIVSRKGKPRTDMPWVESDSDDEEFISFVENFNISSRPQVLELLRKYSSKNIIIFRSRQDAEKFLLNNK